MPFLLVEKKNNRIADDGTVPSKGCSRRLKSQFSDSGVTDLPPFVVLFKAKRLCSNQVQLRRLSKMRTQSPTDNDPALIRL
jgi:hypothetical protein